MSALEDAIAILNCFSLNEPSLSQAELIRRTGCPKATASRVTKILREKSILDYDQNSRLYTPGIRLFELGQICRSNHSFLDMVINRLEKVCEIGGHTGYVTVFDGNQLVVLRMVRGSSPLAITSTPGYRAWPHATSNGRAMLALLPESEWDMRVPHELPFVTKQAPQTHEELRERIALIKETGRSKSRNDAYDGISSEGIALRDPGTGEIIGVAISYPSLMHSEELSDMIANLLDEMKTELLRRK